MSNPPESRLAMRDWQKSGLEKWIQNDFKGCFEVATGGGKTFFAISAMLHAESQIPGLRTVVVVPTQPLLDQWYLSFSEDFHIPESDISVLNAKNYQNLNRINLVVINSARRFDRRHVQANKLLQIVDECHRAGSPQNSKCLIVGSRATIGLSATPSRDYDDGFENLVVPVLGDILVSYTLEDAISDGTLAKLSLRNVRIPLLPSEQDKYDAFSRKIGQAFAQKASEEKIRELLIARSRVSNNAHLRVPVAAKVVQGFSGRRTMVFLESIELAENLAKLLTDKGISATIYHSGLSDGMRRSNLRLFRRGIFDVLVACRALDEGFNVPEAEIAVIAAGTSTRRQRIQRIGRVLRSMLGKERGVVVTLYATDAEETRLQSEFGEMKTGISIEWSAVKIGK